MLRNALDYHGEGQESSVIASFVPPGHRSNAEWLWVMHAQVAEAIEQIGWVDGTPYLLPDEISTTSMPLFEGAVFRVLVNAYERNPEARRQCIQWHGASCCVCGFNFGAVYGKMAEGYIHVHHCRSLSEIGHEYQVNPVEDLRPVCPNCHVILHLRVPALSIEEARVLLGGRVVRAIVAEPRVIYVTNRI
jgi:5-methylcytosine-specific restriction enzyme A